MDTVLELLNEQEFDFTALPAMAQINHTLVNAIDIIPYRSGQLIVRLHDKTMSGAVQTFTVELDEAAPTDEDPANPFRGSTIASALIVPTDASPGLYLDALSMPLPSHACLRIGGRQHSTGGTTHRVTISVSLVLRTR